MRSRLSSALFALLVLASSATAFAGQVGIGRSPRSSATPRSPYVPLPTLAPTPGLTLAPAAALPPIPPPPNGPPGRGASATRRMQSANGSYVQIQINGTCTGSLTYGFSVGCSVKGSFHGGSGVGGGQVAYLFSPGSATPSQVNFGTNFTLSTAGWYVYGAFNPTTNTWDALEYFYAGTVGTVRMYDASGNTINTVTANGSTRVTFVATGLTNGDPYVVGAVNTATTGQCVWLTNQANPTPTPQATATPYSSYCDPTRATATIAASGGQISTSWVPSSALAGTMTVTVWDVAAPSAPVAVAVEQITVQTTAFVPAAGATPTAMPTWQFSQSSSFSSIASPAVFAYYSQFESHNGGAGVANIYARLAYPSQQSGDQYNAVISDPAGSMVQQTNVNANGSNGIYVANNVTFQLENWINGQLGGSSPISQFGWPNATFSMTLLDTTNNARKGMLVAATPFKVVGFSAVAYWLAAGTSVLGSAISVPGTGSTHGQFVYVNNGDAAFGAAGSDSLSQFETVIYSGSPALSDVSFDGNGLHSTTFTDPAGNTWNAAIAVSSGTFTIDFTATGSASLAPGAALTSPTIYVTNANNGCQASCAIQTRIKPVHGNGNLSLDPTGAGANGVFNIVPELFVNNGATSTTAPYAALTHVGYVPSSGGTITYNADAHRYNNGSTPRTQHAVYARDLGTSASGYYDVWRLDFTANGNGDGHDIQIGFPPQFNIGAVLQRSQLGNVGSNFNAQVCNNAPATNYVCLTSGNYSTGSVSVYFAIPPPASAFAYTDVAVKASTQSHYIGTGGVDAVPTAAPSPAANVFVDQYLTSVDALAVAGYSLDATQVSAAVVPSTIGQNQSAYPVTLQVSNSSAGTAINPDSIDAVVVDAADQGGQTLTANGTATPSLWQMESTTTTGAGGVRRYWFSVCPSELTPNDTFGPTATASNGSTINMTPCSTTANWKGNVIRPAGSLQVPLLLKTGTSSIPLIVYVHGANGNGWSAGIPITVNVNAAAANAGFQAAGTYANPPVVTSGNAPQIALKSNATNGDSFQYLIKNTGNANVTSFAVTIPGTDAGGATAYDGIYSWQFTAAPTIVAAPGDTSTYGCALTTPSGASGSYVNATSGGANGHIFVGGCTLPPGKSVALSFSALYPQTVNETYKFTSKVNWTTYNSGTNDTDGISTGETWTGDQTVNVTTATSLVVYVPSSTTSTYSALTPANTANPSVVFCSACTSSTSPNTLSFANFSPPQSQQILDGVLVRLTNAVAPHGWKLYVSSSYNASYSGGGMEFQTAYDGANSTSGASLNATQGGGATTFYDLSTTSPGLGIVDNGATPAIQTPYDMLMSFQVRIGTESAPPQTTAATVTYTWVAN
ncbi:MAG: hypothetical protein JOZ24_02200 [Candidatus Eremiobacteraeota bacterium]|nr:hypothetical protein [Candidatus Eremiobacteraeota bacterium]